MNIEKQNIPLLNITNDNVEYTQISVKLVGQTNVIGS